MKTINMKKNLLLMIGIPICGYLIGFALDRHEDERLSRFRDKSALYRREIPPTIPSW